MESAQIIPLGRGDAPLPSCEPAAIPPPEPAFFRRSSRLDLAGVARKIGMEGRPVRAIVDAIRALMKEGFPAPLNPRVVSGEVLRGPRAVWSRSLWDRDAVEAFLDDNQPPPVAARAGEARRDAVRATLAEAARRLTAA